MAVVSGFWAKALGASPVSAAPALPPAVIPSGTPAASADPGVASAAARAASARSTERCPECDSGNYFRPQGHPDVAPRCYECGYPVRHTTSGVVATGTDKAAVPARQVSTANNYHPTVFIGRIE